MNVVGYDVDGKELHPGDKVILIGCKPKYRHYLGQTFTIKDRHPRPGYVMLAEKPPEAGNRTVVSYGKDLRKINRDCSDPSEFTYEDLMNTIKDKPKVEA